LWIVASVLLWSALATPAVAQVPAPDSGTSSHLSIHIPFVHHRARAERTRSAQPDTTLLLVEAGYDGNFHSLDLARDESSTLTVVVTPMSRLELQADVDVWASETAPHEAAVQGRGDTHLTIQWTAFTMQSGHVAVAVAYDAKLPTASRTTLGTGWVDHRLLTPISFAVGGLQFDAYAGIDADGDPAGLNWGMEAAASMTANLFARLFAHVGVSGQTIDTDQPAGRYVSGGITWQVHPLIAFDVGGRLGVSPRTPAYGLTAGITAAVVTW
jgi:hypothetical protein